MNSKYEELKEEEVPEPWKYLLEYVPALAYWKVHSDFRNSQNFVGHIQRAHSIYWSIITHKKTGGTGLDIGCGTAVSPYCKGIDNYADTDTSGHPIYGGHGYNQDIQAEGEKLPLKDESYEWIISNHSLEHMENTLDTMIEWLRVLKPGGLMAIVMPNRKYGPFGDPSHKHEYTPEEFYNDILIHLMIQGLIRLREYDTFDNNFSFDCVLEKKK